MPEGNLDNYQLNIPNQSNGDQGQIDTTDYTNDEHSSEIVDQPGDDQHFVRLDNSSARDNSIYDKLSEPRYDPESAKIAAEAAIGTLDDNVDITDPDYNESKTERIEQELSSGHYRT